MSRRDPERVTILGAAGAMGGLFARKLFESGHRVTGIDLRATAAKREFASLIRCDVFRPAPEAIAALEEAQVVVIALPDRPALSAIAQVVSQVKENALVVDTLSVKTPVAEALSTLGARGEYLSLNPMFAPSLGFAGQQVVAVRFRDGPRSQAFLRLIESWGATVHERGAEEHDRACAVMQVATHATLLLLGQVVRESGLDPEALLEIAPPPHRLSLALLARILSAAPEVYWDIQKDNPFAADIRAQMARALAELEAMVFADDAKQFDKWLASMRQVLAGPLASLKDLSTRAIESGKDANYSRRA